MAAAAAVLCTTAAAPWPTAAAAAGTPSTAASSYAFAEDAQPVDGAKGTTGAGLLDAGRTYRSSLPRDATLYYRLHLDAASNAYVSVTAVPRADATLSITDGIRVSVQDAHNHSCSNERARFGAAKSPHPITAWGARTTSPAAPVCRGAGTYYVVVERTGTADSSPGAWDLEITTTTEPRLKQAGATSPPETWNSASPTPVSGAVGHSQGGAGFSQAVSVGQGVWSAGITPGQTLFYKIPVGWGQQPSATAELGSVNGDGHGYAIDALALTLYNPVRAAVEDANVGYDGKQKSASLAAVPAVDYTNRYAIPDRVNAMRFAGSYYLVVHLAAGVAQKFGDGPFRLTLRVGIEGAAQDGPGYAGQSVPANVFQITAQDRQAAAEGATADAHATMRAVAAGGIGAGTVVLAVLGVWTVAARRSARAR
ncbi:hypothetical protein ACFY1U_17355 [Streptomyces sp. NPDC001351]|uniref:hypothetical protein n=1 Tax=Streptomyces sp. NPDC001351 TaxID=3364564 RepID=UPI00368A144A